MSDPLCGATGGRHPIDVLMVGFEVEPAAVGRIEHVPNSVATFGQPFGLAPCRRHFPELNVSISQHGHRSPYEALHSKFKGKLLVTQSHNWVDTGRTVCRDIAREERNAAKQKRQFQTWRDRWASRHRAGLREAE